MIGETTFVRLTSMQLASYLAKLGSFQVVYIVILVVRLRAAIGIEPPPVALETLLPLLLQHPTVVGEGPVEEDVAAEAEEPRQHRGEG